MEENKSFMFKNKRCYLKVESYEDTKCLKVSMKDEKEIKEIQKNHLQYVVMKVEKMHY